MFYQKHWFVICVCFLLSFSLQANLTTVAESLPDDTILLVHASDRKENQLAFSHTPLGQLCQEPELASFFKPFEETFLPFIMQADQILASQGTSLEELFSTLGGETYLAVTAVGPMGLDAIFSLELSEENKDNFFLLLERTITSAVPMPVESSEIAGSSFLVFPTPSPMKVYLGLHKNSLVVTTSPQLITQLAEGVAAPLAKAPSFENIFAKGSTSGVSLYLNLASILQMPILPPDAQQLLPMLGIQSWEALGLSMGVKEKNVRSMFSIYAPNHSGQGLVNQLLATPSSKSPHPQHVPSDAYFYVESTSNLVTKLGEFMPMLSSMAPPGMIEPYMEQLGLNDFFELVSEMDSGWSFFQTIPEGGSFFPDGIHLQQIANRKTFEAKLSVVMEKWGFEKKTIQHAGREIYYWRNRLGNGDRFLKLTNMDIDPNLIYLLYPYRSYFFVDDDTIAYSSLVHSLKSYATSISQKYASLASNPDFQERRLSVGDYSAMSYRSRNKNFTQGYRSVLWMIQMLEGIARDFGLPVETALLPQAKTVAQYVTSDMVTYHASDNGFSFLCESGGVPSLSLLSGRMDSATGSLTGVAVIGVVAAIAIPGFLRARISANESSAQAFLRTIATGQAIAQSSLRVDQNQNGIGEYASLGELAGTVPFQGQTEIDPYPYVSVTMDEIGFGEKSGYYFKVYLPEFTEEREQGFIAYAWPITHGETGRRAFVINQTGSLFACHNDYTAYSGFYRIPEAEAAISAEYSDIIAGEIVEHVEATDGQYWFRP